MTLYMFYSKLYRATFCWYGSLTVISWPNGDYQIYRDNHQNDESNADYFNKLCDDSF